MDIMKILVELYLHQIGIEATVKTEPIIKLDSNKEDMTKAVECKEEIN